MWQTLFENATGNIDLEVLDANANVISSSNSNDNNESISVAIENGDKYYIHVHGTADAVQPGYSLVIDTVAPPPGDFTSDGHVDATDIDILCSAVNGEQLAAGDLNSDQVIDLDDVRHLVEEILGTAMGDVDLDGRVNSSDLNILGAHWQTAVDGWSSADFNCDGFVQSTDLNWIGSNWQSGVSPQRVPRAAAGASGDREAIRNVTQAIASREFCSTESYCAAVVDRIHAGKRHRLAARRAVDSVFQHDNRQTVLFEQDIDLLHCWGAID